MSAQLSYQAQEAARKVRWLIGMRFAVALLCISAALLAGGGRRFAVAYVVLGLGAAANLAYLILHPRIRNYRDFAALQIGVDVALVSLLVYATGGVHSHFVYLYFALVVATSMAVASGPGLMVALCAAIVIAVTSLIYDLLLRAGLPIPLVDRSWWPSDSRFGGNVLVARIFILTCAFFLVAMLSGRLAARLRVVSGLSDEILENITEGVLALDKEGRILFANGAAAQLFDFRGVADLVGRRYDEVLRRETDREIREALWSREPARREVQLTTRRRGARAIEIRASALKDHRGEFRGLICLLSDLTPAKQMAEAERRADRLEGIRQLSAGLAHEVRNPLAAIRGTIQEISRDVTLRPDDQKLMHIALRESDRLDAIIREFLNYAKADSVELIRCDIKPIVEEMALLLSKAEEHQDKEIAIECDGALACRGDPGQLRQVFLNLSLNALEAMDDGGVLLIRGSESERPAEQPILPPAAPLRERPAGGIRLDFVDQGKGIDPQIRERIFDPFFSTKPTGTGMGLALALQIVQAHRGEVNVESTLGAGTIISIWLPQQPETQTV